MNTILFPFGKIDEIHTNVILDIDASDTQYIIPIEVNNNSTLVVIDELEEAAELQLIPNQNLMIGAIVTLSVSNAAASTNNLTMAADILGSTITGVAEKTKYAMFFFNGESFVQIINTQVN